MRTTEAPVLDLSGMRERVERFVKNLFSALGHCMIVDGDAIPAATLGLVSVSFLCMFWVMGVVVYDLMLDPHLTAASLNAVSISPDKWPIKI